MDIQNGPSINKSPVCSPVVWAIDAFSKDLDTHAKTAHAILTHSPDSLIHPVYVLSEAMFSNRGYSAFLRPALKPRAHHSIEDVLKHEFFEPAKKVLQRPRVLVEASADASLCTGKLLRYARRIGSKLVAIGTHGRGHFAHWFAGSFAETLMRESSLPLLIAGPREQSDLRAQPRVLVIPTNFLDEENQAFESLLGQASKRKFSLHLIHRARLPIDEGKATRWLEQASQAGVEMRIISENSRESIAEAIIDYARTLDGASPLIALLSHGTAYGTSYGWTRSLLRDLVRQSPYPVYMCGHA